MSQDTDTGGTGQFERPRPAPPTGPWPRQGPPPTGPFTPYPGIPVQGHPLRPAPGWSPIEDEEDPRPPGNPAAAWSVVLAVLALLVSLRPLAFGSMALSWDTYVALGLGVLALGVGIAGARGPVRRPVAAVGMVVAVSALLVVAVLPTL